MNEKMFQVKHRNIFNDIFRVKLPFEDVMLMFYDAAQGPEFSIVKHDILRGEYIFATPRSLRSPGEFVLIKVDMDGKDKEDNEICKISMMSRRRRPPLLFMSAKNYFNIKQLKSVFEDYIQLPDENIDPTSH